MKQHLIKICINTCADPGIFVRGWGMGGPGPSAIKESLIFFCFLFAYKSSTYFTEVQLFISKKINNFPRFQRGSNIFSRGGVSNFFSRGGEGGGASIAHSIKKPHITFVFPGVSGPLVHHHPSPPPSESGHATFGSTGCCDKS